MRPLVALLAALAAAPAFAEDTQPPLITHAPVAEVVRGTTLQVTAQIEDDSEIFAPTLYFRAGARGGYSSVPMLRQGDAFVGAVKVASDLEYWIEAYDEFANGPSRDGTPDRPHHVVAVEQVAVVDVLPDVVPLPDEPFVQPDPVVPVTPLWQQPWVLGSAGVVVTALVVGLVAANQETVYRNTFGVTAARP